MIVIGSYPVKDLLGRSPVDVDLLASLDEFREYIGAKPRLLDANHACYEGDIIYDCELIWPGSLSEQLAEIIMNDPETVYDESLAAYVPSKDIIYMLKMTHRFKKKSPHFRKTMDDIKLLRKAGAKIPEQYMEFYKARERETLNYSHPNLKQEKKTFFNPEDSFYLYDHDSIHEAVALGPKPAYLQYSIDGQEVLCSKKKFFECDEITRLLGVYEEACVLALERSLIPFNFEITEEQAFKIALEKVCTSITSGWFREYAWENYDKVLELFRCSGSFKERFVRNESRLRPYVG